MRTTIDQFCHHGITHGSIDLALRVLGYGCSYARSRTMVLEVLQLAADLTGVDLTDADRSAWCDTYQCFDCRSNGEWVYPNAE